MNWTINPSSSLRGDISHARRQIDFASRVDACRVGAGREPHSELPARGRDRSDDALCARSGRRDRTGTARRFTTSVRLIVHGGQLRSPAANLDCGNSGATIRMLMGALAGQPDLVVTLDGSAGLRRRPMKRVAEPLRLMGADLGDTPPLGIHGRPLHGIEYTMPVASAQVKAAIFLAALQAKGPTTIHEPGPSRDHSERMLQSFGVICSRRGITRSLSRRPKSLSLALKPSFPAIFLRRHLSLPRPRSCPIRK